MCWQSSLVDLIRKTVPKSDGDQWRSIISVAATNPRPAATLAVSHSATEGVGSECCKHIARQDWQGRLRLRLPILIPLPGSL